MNKQRREALTTVAIIGLMAFEPARAQQCSKETIKAEREKCLSALNEMRNMLDLARQVNEAAKVKLTEAIKPSFEVGEVIFALIQGCAIKKNPSDCAKAVLEIPGAIENVDKIIGIVNETKSLLRQAQSTRGAGEVGWFEQGGDDAMHKLIQCGEPGCQTVYQSFLAYSEQLKATIERNDAKMNQFLKDLEDTKNGLRRCAANQEDCAGLKELSVPSLEEPNQPPAPTLP